MGRITEFLDQLTLEQRIERLELALDGSGLGIWDWDPRDNSVQFDRRWCEMLGLDHASTPMELATWESRVHPDDLARCYQDIQAHVEGRTPLYENVHRLRHADGRWIHILDRGCIYERDREGRPMRFTGTHEDISAQRRAKEQLALHKQQLRSMVENLPVPVVMLDVELRFVAASALWLAEHGLDEHQVIGQTYAEIFPEADRRWWGIFAQGLAGGALNNAEEAFENPDGSYDWVRWSVRPWKREGDAVGGIIVVQENVSHERQQRSAQEQESRLAALGLLAGAVGHEINTPLQVALLEAEEMLYEVRNKSASGEDLEQSAEAICATITRINEIVSAMRTLSRDAQPEAKPVSVRNLFENIQLLSGGRAREQEILLEFVEHTPNLSVLGQASELGQVLLNLLNNAFEAVHKQTERWVRISAERSRSGVEFRCVDSGPGVAKMHAQRLMQPFFTTKPVGQGTGLGLSISHALARRMNGFLRYDPDAAFTTFVLGLPEAAAETAA